MDLQIHIFVVLHHSVCRKGAFCDQSILPRKREDTVSHDKIKLQLFRCVFLFTVIVDGQPGNTHHLCRCAQCKSKLFIHVRHAGEVVRLAEVIPKFLCLLVFQRNDNLLIHQKISPVFSSLLCHASSALRAINILLTVKHLIMMEFLDIPFIPAAPCRNILIECFRYGLISQFPELRSNTAEIVC